jgi:hypothetical protein
MIKDLLLMKNRYARFKKMQERIINRILPISYLEDIVQFTCPHLELSFLETLIQKFLQKVIATNGLTESKSQ